MSLDLDNFLFCIHLETPLSDQQRSALVESLDDQIIGTWTLSSNQKSCRANLANTCVVISAPVKLKSNFFKLITEASQKYQKNIFYTDLAWESNFNRGIQSPIDLPEWSYFRFLSNDYLGAVISIPKKISEKIKLPNISRHQVTGAIVSKKLTPHLIHENAYVQTGADLFIPIEDRVELIKKHLPKQLEKLKISKINESLIKVSFKELAPKKISVVIPTRGTIDKSSGQSLVVQALNSTIRQELKSSKLELVVVYDTDSDLDYLREIEEIARDFELKKIAFNESFNFSRKCNLGAENSTGDVVLFLNDDTKWITSDGLLELSGAANVDNVGAAGAKLYFKNGLLQHAGMITVGGNVGHAYFKSKGHVGYFGDLQAVHEVMGVTGACIAQRLDTWKKSAGWDELFSNSYNDVDYNFRLRNSGLSILQLNTVELFHYESLTREAVVSEFDFQLIRSRWASDLESDKYMSQSITLDYINQEPTRSFRRRLVQAVAILKNYGLKTLILRSTKYFRKKLNF